MRHGTVLLACLFFRNQATRNTNIIYITRTSQYVDRQISFSLSLFLSKYQSYNFAVFVDKRE